MSAVAVVIGEGLWADWVGEELSASCEVIRQAGLDKGVPETADLALVLGDAWHPSVHARAEEVFRAAGIPWLRGFAALGEAVIGPLVRPGRPGCSQCADMRRLMAGGSRLEMRELQQRLAEHGGAPRDVWASRNGLLHAAHLTAAEAKRVMEGRPAQLEEHLLLIHLKTLKSSRHFFLPDPMCPVCGRPPEDSREAARLTLRPSPKISPDSFRTRPMDELRPVLTHDYLDFRTGLMNGKMLDLATPFADVIVNLPLMAGDEGTAGRTLSYRDSEPTAILEGLERYCGLMPRGKQTAVRGSYRSLGDQALNPLKAGVHAEEQYARPDFPFRPFDPDRPMDWVWGYSFLQERPILVPERLAYYSLACSGGFVYETSNGCALGGSLEEAVFHGIMEAAERDSFLLTWYAQLPLPRLDYRAVQDTELQLMIDRMETVTGYELHVFNSTMEYGIPSLWVIAKNNKPQGMNLICAAGSHPDPVRALKSSIYELAGMMQSLDGKSEGNREASERMLRDPYLVREMEHHSMLYGLPEAEERLHFLLKNDRPSQTFDEAFKPRARYADLTEDLKEILAAFRRLQLDVIVVDQTAPELRRAGLWCVKVLIPGLLPMTFGYHLTRLTGLERVLKVPQLLGYTQEPLAPGQLNPHPHPFP